MIVIDREADTVTMSRAEYQALIEAAEDADDLAHLATQKERERILGIEAARRDYLPGEPVKRMLKGEHPVQLWREQRGLTLSDLARIIHQGGEAAAPSCVSGRAEPWRRRRGDPGLVGRGRRARAGARCPAAQGGRAARAASSVRLPR